MVPSGRLRSITIGDQLHDRHQVVHTLALGTYSTIGLVRDQQFNEHFAVKVSSTNLSLLELSVLSELPNP